VAQADAAFASFEKKWMAAHPESAYVALFLPPKVRARASAFGALIHELEQSAFHVREPTVAAAKLAWWRQELGAAANGQARHPLARELFSRLPERRVDPALWPALAEGALSVIDTPAPSSLADSLRDLAPFYGAAAATESALFLPPGANTEADGTLWTISHLLEELAMDAQGSVRLPLDLLARHGLARADFANPRPARAEFGRDYLDALLAQMRDCLAASSARTLTRRVRTRLDLALVTAGRRAPDPLVHIAAHARPGGLRSLWTAWIEARANAALLDY
jgi:15-cis-phytoene synthase